ncbi:MAG: hypothetical protein J6U20_07260 [Fibrobacter sp.]|nr:hypothetical protein [Fibrobacter sp.]
MQKIVYFAAMTVSILCFFACSQTVKAPSQDDDEEAEYSSSSTKNNSSKDSQTKKSSSSKSSDWDDDEDYDDEDYDDEDYDFDYDDGSFTDTIPLTRSPIQFTGDKIDCEFSIDDTVWTREKVDTNSTSISYISFDENAMKVKMEVNAKIDSGYTCDETLAIWAFVMALSGGKDIDGSCTDDSLIAMGTLVDSTRTIKDKEEVYKEICN